MPTNISWTDESWNPVTGCTPVSEGCAHCYAKKAYRRTQPNRSFSEVVLHPDRLDIPLHWRKPRMVFVPSMGDLFHEDVPDGFIAAVWGVMSKASQHTFQVLTKRPGRMRRALALSPELTRAAAESWPLPNVWLGVSVENQDRADERIPLLLDTPAAVRFVSAEPLLGPLDLERWLRLCRLCYAAIEQHVPGRPHGDHEASHLDWVIVGGESGGPPERRLVERCGTLTHGHSSRPVLATMDIRCELCAETGWRPKPEALGWVRDIRDQCEAAGVPFFFKQLGPRAGQGTLLDGVEHREMPEVRA